ncbi:MAG: tyrosine-type recombinase/integrase [Candidatus Limnocylindria bacterium]
MTRRDYGTGSIRQLPDGTWQGRVDLGRASDGTRRRTAFRGKSRREIQRAIGKAISERESGFGVRPSERLTTGAFLDQWLGASAPASLRPRTLVGYRSIVRRHLAPSIGRIPLAKLNGAHVQELVNGLVKGGASPQTVRNVHAVLRRALGQAVRWGILHRNVALAVDLPAARAYDVRALAIDDARQIIDACRGDRLEPLVTLALATGLRQGEALALRWDDVDLPAAQMAVRHTLHRSGGVVLSEPKTRRSRRAVTLPAFAVTALRRQRDWFQAQDRLLAAEDWQEGGYVFTTRRGTPMHGPDVTRRLQRLLAAAELPRMRFHDLRHGAATLLLSQGVHPRVVMETLGHSTIAVTMNVYSHVVPALQRDAADRLDAAFASNGHNMDTEAATGPVG